MIEMALRGPAGKMGVDLGKGIQQYKAGDKPDQWDFRSLFTIFMDHYDEVYCKGRRVKLEKARISGMGRTLRLYYSM